MPIFLHCLDILRVNLYVLYKETPYNHDNAPCKDPTILHKGTTGKLVMSRNNPSLSIFENLQYCPGVHELVPARKQSKCKYCQYLVLVLNRKEAPPYIQHL